MINWLRGKFTVALIQHFHRDKKCLNYRPPLKFAQLPSFWTDKKKDRFDLSRYQRKGTEVDGFCNRSIKTVFQPEK